MRICTFIYLLCILTIAWLVYPAYSGLLIAHGQSPSGLYLPSVANGTFVSSAIELDVWADVYSLPEWGLLVQTLEAQGIRPIQEAPGQIQLHFLQGEAIEYMVKIHAKTAEDQPSPFPINGQNGDWDTIVDLFQAKQWSLDQNVLNRVILSQSRSSSDLLLISQNSATPPKTDIALNFLSVTFVCTTPQCQLSVTFNDDGPTNTPEPTATSTSTVAATVTATATPTIPQTVTVTSTATPAVTPTATATSTATPAVNELRIGSGSVEPGDQLDLWVEVTTLQPGKSLGAVAFEIVYNPALVTPISCLVNLGNRFDLSLCNIEESGVARLNALSTSGVAPAPIQIARITFQAVGQAGQTGALDLQITTFADTTGNPLVVGDTDGQITISQPTASGPTLGQIATNLSSYTDSQLPRFEKLELTFDLTTVATNLQVPYDASPPPGVQPGVGVSVDALFTPDNWQTVYTQPAFYYQDFQYEIKGNQEWMYPTDNFDWKVRFSPNQEGNWQYKIVARDASGSSETVPQSFIVTSSPNKGFIRVSKTDSRYFEHDDGSYFPGLGYNMNYDHVSWINPLLDNQENFQAMGQNGIQLARIWLSQWAIYGSEWNPWQSIDPAQHGQYLPNNGVQSDEAAFGSEFSMRIKSDVNPCMFIGVWKARSAVKRNTNYQIRIRYKLAEITGPRISGQPYGFVAKTGGWLWGDGTYCQDPGVGTVVSARQAQNTTDWQILEGTFNSGNSDFLPNFFLVLDNVSSGTVYVDYVWIQETLGNGEYGPNIVSKPWMAHHLYMEQRNSYAFDKVLELAEQYNVYIRPVIHEKNERIFNRIDYEGNTIPYDTRCSDHDPNNNPSLCWGNQWFYGDGRNITKTRWLQQAWWRYLQARWGYSPNIHSWELLNEGDPWDRSHYTLADEFGKYMHQFKPNDHLVSTSMWHSFPKNEFWASTSYPHIDFADVHQYISESDPLFNDTAQATYSLSMQIGAKQSSGAGKPVIRGETGFVVSSSEPASSMLLADSNAIWLHNFIWGGINPGGLIESYWYETNHIYKRNSNGTYAFDHRSKYRTYYNFIEDIPLSNGYYQDAQATTSHTNLRAWGQKDLSHGCAHLWIQNAQHTWKNIVDGVSIAPISETISLSGFQPNMSYTVQHWDIYQSDKSLQVVQTTTVASLANGTLVLPVNNLTSDYAVKVISPNGCG